MRLHNWFCLEPVFNPDFALCQTLMKLFRHDSGPSLLRAPGRHPCGMPRTSAPQSAPNYHPVSGDRRRRALPPAFETIVSALLTPGEDESRSNDTVCCAERTALVRYGQGSTPCGKSQWWSSLYASTPGRTSTFTVATKISLTSTAVTMGTNSTRTTAKMRTAVSQGCAVLSTW